MVVAENLNLKEHLPSTRKYYIMNYINSNVLIYISSQIAVDDDGNVAEEGNKD